MVHGELFVTIILILKLRQLCVECWAILGELLFEAISTFSGDATLVSFIFALFLLDVKHKQTSYRVGPILDSLVAHRSK